MGQIEKTVFLSYRRTNALAARAIFQNLTHHGFDVFLDFHGIASGDFETVILENIRARAHFVVLLTPSALETCGQPGDWLRREIEFAIAAKRNIVPLMLEGFSFNSPGIKGQLTGKLEVLRNYNAISVPAEFFDEAMDRLRTKFLNIPLEMVLHPASASAVGAAKAEQRAASAVPAVTAVELTAEEWFERGSASEDLVEQIRCFSRAIELRPNYAFAFNCRGNARFSQGDREGAMWDYNQAIRLDPNLDNAFCNRAKLRARSGDSAAAIADLVEGIRLNPNDVEALESLGVFQAQAGDFEDALKSFERAISIDPLNAELFVDRGSVRGELGDLEGALRDYEECLRLEPANERAAKLLDLARRVVDLNRQLAEANSQVADAERELADAEREEAERDN